MLLWLRPKYIHVSGKKPPKYRKGILVACNHVSFADPVMLLMAFWYRRLHCVANKELCSDKFMSFFFKNVGCILIDKEHFSIGSMKEACNLLKNDKAVVIFPEGTVDRTDELLSFKGGAVMMAYLGRQQILPVYLVPPKSKWERRVMIYGDPVDICSMMGDHATKEKVAELSLYLHEKEEELKAFYENKVKSKKRKGSNPVNEEK